MSCVRCSRCSEIVDSDDDPECFTCTETAPHGDGPILCEPCREGYYCTSCGEMPRAQDEPEGRCTYCACFDVGGVMVCSKRCGWEGRAPTFTEYSEVIDTSKGPQKRRGFGACCRKCFAPARWKPITQEATA